MKTAWRRINRKAFVDQRGTVWVLTLVLLLALMVVAGLAIDTMHAVAVRNELQKSMDAAALAGAGNLGFSASLFPTARLASQTYAGLNPYSGGTITLGVNTGNAANGDIVLGLFNAADGSFTPTLDPTFVNAVQCRTSQVMPTSFMGLIGWPSLTISADAIGVASPPASIPPNGCLFPMGVTKCPFVAGGTYGTSGCGQPFSTQSNTPTNTSGWIQTNNSFADPSQTSTPTANQTRAAVNAAAGVCTGTTLKVGEYVGTQGGQDANVYNGTGQESGLGKCNSSGAGCTGLFVNKFNASTAITLKDKDENTTYNGKGWEVYVPVMNTPCPPGQFNGPMQILTFGRVIITQVINGGYCAVANHYPGNLWDNLCPAPNGFASTRDPNLKAVFGYYDCQKFDAPPVPIAPVAALGTRLRLVK
ncbi:MAG TPA: pilus assembly protein TadG-related protein [Methylomirabilota bacterium]|nr:pilus assembly protein TadG-related protein [Methylomirabilota bacterium]